MIVSQLSSEFSGLLESWVIKGGNKQQLKTFDLSLILNDRQLQYGN